MAKIDPPLEMEPSDIHCDIFFHIPKTGGQTFQNLVLREYRNELVLNTHCGVLTPLVWQQFLKGLTSAQPLPRYRAVIGHMKFGLHEVLPNPARYFTFLRDPVKRFVSYYYTLRIKGIVPTQHRIDLSRPDWNLSDQETLLRELDNGQTRALANADWDLPFGHCTEEHFKKALAHLDRYFAFVGVTEHFDLSLMALKHLCGWRWHLYARKNITPAKTGELLPSKVLQEIAGINRFDQQLHAYAQARLEEVVRRYGVGLRLEHRAYVASNAVHQCLHHTIRALKKRGKRVEKRT